MENKHEQSNIGLPHKIYVDHLKVYVALGIDDMMYVANDIIVWKIIVEED